MNRSDDRPERDLNRLIQDTMEDQPDLFQPDHKAISKIGHDYGNALGTPNYSERKEKTAKLRAYAQSLAGRERELIRKYWPDLLNPISSKPRRTPMQ